MQVAKQMRFSRNRRRWPAVSSRSRLSMDPIQRKQNSALRRMDGMFSTAAKAAWRSSMSGM